MERFHADFSCLDLTIAMPAYNSSPSLPSPGEMGGGAMKGLDINQMPSSGTEEESMEEEDESPNGGPAPRKKLRLTKQQSYLLEESFTHNHTLNLTEKEILAEQLHLKPRQVEVWFQNRRARSKLKQTETECKYFKRWFGSLTEQNRRLQKEVEELRAIKVGHPFRRLSPPASTLTMCPRCERVSAATNSKLPRLRPPETYAACYN